MTVLSYIGLTVIYGFLFWGILAGSRKAHERESFDTWVQRREEKTRRR